MARPAERVVLAARPSAEPGALGAVIPCAMGLIVAVRIALASAP